MNVSLRWQTHNPAFIIEYRQFECKIVSGPGEFLVLAVDFTELYELIAVLIS